MSHYINSFLIEPVVRQARRFSRPNNQPYAPQGEDDISQSQDAPATAATAAEEEESVSRLEIEDDGSAGNISRDMDVGTPTSLDDRHGGGLAEWQDGQSSSRAPQVVDANDRMSALSARRVTLQDADDASASPLSGADRLFSTASSLSSSHSLLDPNMSPAEGMAQTLRAAGADRMMGGETIRDRIGDGSLPANDGMGPMRKRIIAIQRTDSSNEEKARLVHGLMTEKHNVSQQSLTSPPHMPRAHSPASFQSSDRPFTPSSPKSTDSPGQTVSPPTSSGSVTEVPRLLHLTPEDLKPTYYEKLSLLPREEDDSRRSSETDEEPKALGCAHYKRNIKLQCSACCRWYTCRFCHDAVEDHMLNRKETKNMLCMLCGCAQPASEECTLCSERGAWYYCDVCKLWDDDLTKSIYHCNDCGICRVGEGLGKDFFHCKTCSVCMSISIRDTHRCIERSTDCDCPICGDYMFTSPEAVVFMRCGHSIHHNCYTEHMKSSYRCPICSRSMVNMEWQFSRLQRAIEEQPMPEEFRDTKAWVYCNDCSAKTSVQYHWLGLKCAVCDSYNTAQLQILSGPDLGGASPQDVPPGGPLTPATTAATLTPPSRPPSRGRHRHPHHHESQVSRSGNSAPPPGTMALNRHVPISRTHSANPGNATASTFTFSPSPSASSSDADGSVDEYDEVDFWGGESPGAARHSSPPAVQSAASADNVAIDGESGEDDDDEEDSEDEAMDEGEGEEEEDEGGEAMELELFGHR